MSEKKTLESLQSIVRWAYRSRKHLELVGLIIQKDFQIRPLIVEFDGMAGAGKSRLIEILRNCFISKFGTIYSTESRNSVFDWGDNHWNFAEKEFEAAKKYLEGGFLGKQELVLIDRGVSDFFFWSNFYHGALDGVSEEKFNRFHSRISETVRKGMIDILFIFMGDPEECAKAKEQSQSESSLSHLDSVLPHSREPEEVLRRYKVYRLMYDALFCQQKNRDWPVKLFKISDIDKDFKRDYDSRMAEISITISLHLVFKAWESLFLAFKKGREELDDNEIEKLKGLLKYCFILLRQRIDRDDFNSRVRESLLRQAAGRYVIAEHQGKKIVLEDFFKEPLDEN